MLVHVLEVVFVLVFDIRCHKGENTIVFCMSLTMLLAVVSDHTAKKVVDMMEVMEHMLLLS